MIKAVIFDLNGVFIQSPYLSKRIEEEYGISEKEFLPVLKEIMDKVRKPDAGDAFNYWKPYLKKWGISLTKEQLFSFWFEAEKEVPEMIELAKELKKKGIMVFILSNNFVERADYYRKKFPFLEKIFNKVYYSWQTSFIKPNPEAFRKLLTDNNLKAEECIYFDDSEENIKVAEELGIKSFLFNNKTIVRKILENNNLI